MIILCAERVRYIESTGLITPRGHFADDDDLPIIAREGTDLGTVLGWYPYTNLIAHEGDIYLVELQ